MENKFVLCNCGSPEHQFILSYDPDETNPQDQILYLQVHLVTWEGFFRRLWTSLKYALGHRSRYGEFDEVLVNRTQAEEIQGFITEYLSFSKR